MRVANSGLVMTFVYDKRLWCERNIEKGVCVKFRSWGFRDEG